MSATACGGNVSGNPEPVPAGGAYLGRVKGEPVRAKRALLDRRLLELLFPRLEQALPVQLDVDLERRVVVDEELVEVKLDGESCEGVVAYAAAFELRQRAGTKLLAPPLPRPPHDADVQNLRTM